MTFQKNNNIIQMELLSICYIIDYHTNRFHGVIRKNDLTFGRSYLIITNRYNALRAEWKETHNGREIQRTLSDP